MNQALFDPLGVRKERNTVLKGIGLVVSVAVTGALATAEGDALKSSSGAP